MKRKAISILSVLGTVGLTYSFANALDRAQDHTAIQAFWFIMMFLGFIGVAGALIVFFIILSEK